MKSRVGPTVDRPIFRKQSNHTLSRQDVSRQADLVTYRARSSTQSQSDAVSPRRSSIMAPMPERAAMTVSAAHITVDKSWQGPRLGRIKNRREADPFDARSARGVPGGLRRRCPKSRISDALEQDHLVNADRPGDEASQVLQLGCYSCRHIPGRHPYRAVPAGFVAAVLVRYHAGRCTK